MSILQVEYYHKHDFCSLCWYTHLNANQKLFYSFSMRTKCNIVIWLRVYVDYWIAYCTTYSHDKHNIVIMFRRVTDLKTTQIYHHYSLLLTITAQCAILINQYHHDCLTVVCAVFVDHALSIIRWKQTTTSWNWSCLYSLRAQRTGKVLWFNFPCALSFQRWEPTPKSCYNQHKYQKQMNFLTIQLLWLMQGALLHLILLVCVHGL